MTVGQTSDFLGNVIQTNISRQAKRITRVDPSVDGTTTTFMHVPIVSL